MVTVNRRWCFMLSAPSLQNVHSTIAFAVKTVLGDKMRSLLTFQTMLQRIWPSMAFLFPLPLWLLWIDNKVETPNCGILAVIILLLRPIFRFGQCISLQCFSYLFESIIQVLFRIGRPTSGGFVGTRCLRGFEEKVCFALVCNCFASFSQKW